MNDPSILSGLPAEPLSPEQEQKLLAEGNTEAIVLHTLREAFFYAKNNIRSKVSFTNAEVLSICYSALTHAVKNFKPNRQTFLAYSKVYIRGEICKGYKARDVVKNAFKNEVPEEELPTSIPKEEFVEPEFDKIHCSETWALVAPVIKKTLTAEERMVLEYRYGAQLTLQDTGDKIRGLSRERIRQIEAAALDKLRKALKR